MRNLYLLPLILAAFPGLYAAIMLVCYYTKDSELFMSNALIGIIISIVLLIISFGLLVYEITEQIMNEEDQNDPSRECERKRVMNDSEPLDHEE